MAVPGLAGAVLAPMPVVCGVALGAGAARAIDYGRTIGEDCEILGTIINRADLAGICVSGVGCGELCVWSIALNC